MTATLGRHALGRGPALALALLLGAGACGGGTVADPFRPPGETQIRIEVTNLNYNDATLHARRGGERHRLGIVTGKSNATYVMSWPLSLPLQVEIDLLAGSSCVTRPLQVDPGDIVQLQIDVELRNDPDCTPIRSRWRVTDARWTERASATGPRAVCARNGPNQD